MSAFPTLSDLDLERVVGGVDAAVCTPDNPTGARQPTQFLERSHAGPSLSQRVIESTDRAMAPWKTFNSIFGGARGPRPQAPPAWRPTIQ
jgi:hypothetical protein